MPVMSNNLPPINDWQYQITLIASHLALNLLERDKIIEFTHYLMDNGYYDDLMLDIIDDCDFLTFNELSELLSKILKNLNLITLNKEQAKYFYTFSLIYPFTICPPTLTFLCHQYLQDTNFDEKILQKISPFFIQNVIQCQAIDDLKTFNDYAYAVEHYIDPIYNNGLINASLSFIEKCETWLTLHKNDIIAIFNQFNKNPL